jgi:hypothetical protein
MEEPCREVDNCLGSGYTEENQLWGLSLKCHDEGSQTGHREAELTREES